MAITVYWISGSPFAWRVLLALEFKRLPYESRLLSVQKGDLASPDYLSINPRGKVCKAVESLPGYERSYPPHWRGQ